MIGILVHGDNHFIVEGPRPDSGTAQELVRHWSIIRIGAVTPEPLQAWKIINKAFRENLEWAVIVPASTSMSAAVRTLLDELEARGIPSSHGDD